MSSYDFQNDESEALRVRLVVQMKIRHDKILSEEEVDTINEIYGDAENKQVKKLLQYRLVNCFLSIFIMVLLFVLGDKTKWYLTILISVVFFVTNLFLAFYNAYEVAKFNRK